MGDLVFRLSWKVGTYALLFTTLVDEESQSHHLNQPVLRKKYPYPPIPISILSAYGFLRHGFAENSR